MNVNNFEITEDLTSQLITYEKNTNKFKRPFTQKISIPWINSASLGADFIPYKIR